MNSNKIKNLKKFLRGMRVSAKMHGTALKPRLSVHRSLRHISAQLIDDDANKTLIGVSDVGLDINGNKSEKAKAVGKKLAEIAKEKGVCEVVFDRGSNRYHGRVAALADSAREAGLKF
jgi:large subunit ribosomal protein L18